MDITWDTFLTPFGPAVSLHLGDAIAALVITDEPGALAAGRLAGGAPAHSPGASDRLSRQVAEYLTGDRRDFDVPVDLRLASTSTAAVLTAVRDIPYGTTVSYGRLAAIVGRPGAPRAIGAACRASPLEIVVPLHRVVRADGSVAAPGPAGDRRRALLEIEHAGAAMVSA